MVLLCRWRWPSRCVGDDSGWFGGGTASIRESSPEAALGQLQQCGKNFFVCRIQQTLMDCGKKHWNVLKCTLKAWVDFTPRHDVPYSGNQSSIKCLRLCWEIDILYSRFHFGNVAKANCSGKPSIREESAVQ